METKQLQQELFRHLREKLPSHLSLADELCELLDLSSDSVYRRIRGEKPITLDELQKICLHYRFSLDHLLHLNYESVLFQAPGIDHGSLPFLDYMEGMLGQFRYFNSFKHPQILYLAKDTPFWYFFLFPEMAAFKTFFWRKTILNDAALADEFFSFDGFESTPYYSIGQQILEEHTRMRTIELWNLESINSSINQIAFYRDAGIFRDKNDLLAVVDAFSRMLDHIQDQVAQGKKFRPGASPDIAGGSLQFYINELILGNNTILLKLDDLRMCMITYNVFGYLTTADARFNDQAFDSFQSLLTRSTLVSGSGEKERSRFFYALRNRVNDLRK